MGVNGTYMEKALYPIGLSGFCTLFVLMFRARQVAAVRETLFRDFSRNSHLVTAGKGRDQGGGEVF